MTQEQRIEMQQAALSRAANGGLTANYMAIYAGFEAKGIADVRPRENVFTFNAWKALGRSVRKGEHGVKCFTYIVTQKDGEEPTKRCVTTVVFHESQTDAI